jgi:hypothetical protein
MGHLELLFVQRFRLQSTLLRAEQLRRRHFRRQPVLQTVHRGRIGRGGSILLLERALVLILNVIYVFWIKKYNPTLSKKGLTWLAASIWGPVWESALDVVSAHVDLWMVFGVLSYSSVGWRWRCCWMFLCLLRLTVAFTFGMSNLWTKPFARV